MAPSFGCSRFVAFCATQINRTACVLYRRADHCDRAARVQPTRLRSSGRYVHNDRKSPASSSSSSVAAEAAAGIRTRRPIPMRRAAYWRPLCRIAETTNYCLDKPTMTAIARKLHLFSARRQSPRSARHAIQ